jgi:Protein of unknown function (DUF2845)
MNNLCYITLLLALVSHAAFALRCDDLVVEPGLAKVDVYDLCGEPDAVESHYERRGFINHAEFGQYGGYNNPNAYAGGQFNYGQQNFGSVDIFVEEWVYDFGRSRLRQLLRFENGRLITITDLGRGRRR